VGEGVVSAACGERERTLQPVEHRRRSQSSHKDRVSGTSRVCSHRHFSLRIIRHEPQHDWFLT
jgi:hypothetical protein